jgi:hypothetical protein
MQALVGKIVIHIVNDMDNFASSRKLRPEMRRPQSEIEKLFCRPIVLKYSMRPRLLLVLLHGDHGRGLIARVRR